MRFTGEQRVAIERREGDLLLDASAGSGKTSVLVERFARSVCEDGLEVGRILTITFTEKAAAELRERIRGRLREMGAEEAARDTEGAWISTIHAFCARLLRSHALAAGLDPAFAVLEAHEADELSSAAFDAALAAVAGTPGGSELIASHGPPALRAGILSVHGELRSRGELRPVLPAVAPGSAADAESSRREALRAAQMAAAELGTINEPAMRVGQALAALERAPGVLAAPVSWPGELAGIGIPARNGATALKTDACDGYRDALAAYRAVTARQIAVASLSELNALLAEYTERYAALKAEHSAVDFDDLELLARDLLQRDEIAARYRERFAHVMVDELQDTNRVQLELIDLVANGNLFMVGDAQQSIYGFRHAEVELFQTRGAALEAVGARASLQTNFRTRAEILTALNAAFSVALGERFRPLVAGRVDEPAMGPLVELQIVDKAADWEAEGLSAPWRLAEARALGARVRALIQGGEAAAGDVVVLTRATTDLRAYERALEDAGVPTYVIGGRGYWAHPQVVEMVGYLRALANPRDEEAFYGTLASPLCGLSLDGLVLVAADARDELSFGDRARLERFEAWFAGERVAAARVGAEALLDRAIERTGYDLAVLGMPGGRRRLANVRKLMRLARQWEAKAGSDLPGFLGLIAQRSGRADGMTAGAGRESEAPVESEGLDAVRLMTIHRAKGLEFPIVVVADLGRGPTFRPPLIRVGADGRRVGVRIASPGTAARINALDYDELNREQLAAEEAEERRLFYVAMTRARERLILSGAAKMDTWEKGNRSTPIDWIGSSFVADLATRTSEPQFVTDLGVQVRFISEDDSGSKKDRGEPKSSPSQVAPTFAPPVLGEVPTPPPALPVPTLSHSALTEYRRCGYRFYAERILGLPLTAGEASVETSAAAHGTRIHELLQLHDFARPETAPLEIAAVAGSVTAVRLRNATNLRREQRFAFPLAGTDTLIVGTFDVLATEDDRTLIVDYKTGAVRSYEAQRNLYALAALQAGATTVEVVHLFLTAPAEPINETFTVADRPRLEGVLAKRTAGLRAGRFPVAEEPHLGLCAGCPAADGLCSWPVEMTSRSSPDRLF